MADYSKPKAATEPVATKPVSEAPSKPYERVMALPEWLRKELNYLAFMSPDPVKKEEFYHNIAVSGERILRKLKESS